MPMIIGPILVLFGFIREGWNLFKQPKYRALIVWVAIVLAIGTVFFNNVEGWGWLDSLYFSVVTLTTVGYGDFAPTTELGKGFTIVYTFLGLGFIATFASMLARERLTIYESRLPDGDEDAGQAA